MKVGILASAHHTAGGGGFNPQTDITWHSLFWAEGTAFTALGLSDTDAVTTWPNETAESDATRTATTIVYDAAHASFNNMPVVDAHSNGYMTFTPGVDPTQPTSVVIVAKWDSLATAAVAVCDANANIRIFGDATKWNINNGSADRPSTSASDTTTAHMLVGLFSSTGNERLWVDGADEVNAAAGSGGFVGAINIFANASGSFRMDGAIALIGWYEGDITADGEYANLKTWVASHYGLTIA